MIPFAGIGFSALYLSLMLTTGLVSPLAFCGYGNSGESVKPDHFVQHVGSSPLTIEVAPFGRMGRKHM